MTIARSRVAAVLTALYLILAVYVAQDEVRNAHGGWINLRGFGTVLVTAPSQIILSPVLKAFGVFGVNYAELGFDDYAQIALHVLVTATIVYFVVAGLRFLCVKIVRAVRRPPGD